LKRAVIKLGGSLARGGNLRSWLDAAAELKLRAAIVPGGGAFADGVRQAQTDLGFSDGLAHRLALKAMENFGEVLVEFDARFTLAAGWGEFDAAWSSGRTPVWAPLALAAECPDIPASWDMTSDSLAAWLAAKLDARLIVIKSAAPDDAQISADEAARQGITDPLFPAFLARAGGEAVWLGPCDWAILAEAAGGHAPSGARIVPPVTSEGC
jgi:5-(aminomethyl)-3-furanmethanol phosphate kinase